MTIKEALISILAVLESHVVVTEDCDRRGDLYCNCLDRVIEKAKEALKNET